MTNHERQLLETQINSVGTERDVYKAVKVLSDVVRMILHQIPVVAPLPPNRMQYFTTEELNGMCYVFMGSTMEYRKRLYEEAAAEMRRRGAL